MQSACVADIENKFQQANPETPRKGFFVTNDRIASFISAGLHKNRTILSVKDKDELRLTAVWNTCNRSRITKPLVQARMIDPIRFRSMSRNSTLFHGGNKKKYGGTFLEEYKQSIKQSFENFIREHNIFLEYVKNKKILKDPNNIIFEMFKYIIDYKKIIYNYISNYLELSIYNITLIDNGQYIHPEYNELLELFTLENEEKNDSSRFLIKTFLKLFFNETTFNDIIDYIEFSKNINYIYFYANIIRHIKEYENSLVHSVSDEDDDISIFEYYTQKDFESLINLTSIISIDYPEEYIHLMNPSYAPVDFDKYHPHRDLCGILSIYLYESNHDIPEYIAKHVSAYQQEVVDPNPELTDDAGVFAGGKTKKTKKTEKTENKKKSETKKNPKNKNIETKEKPKNKNIETKEKPKNKNIETKEKPKNKNIETKEKPKNKNIEIKEKLENKKLSLKEYNDYAIKLNIKPSNSKNKVNNLIKNININSLNLKQLKVYCKFNNLKGYSKLNKDEIIKLLKH